MESENVLILIEYMVTVDRFPFLGNGHFLFVICIVKKIILTNFSKSIDKLLTTMIQLDVSKINPKR